MTSMIEVPDRYRVWSWQKSADPCDLLLEERPLPVPEPGELLVRNEAIGLNPVDWKVLDRDLVSWQRGHIPGVDGAGTVVALGPDVGPAWLGRRVAYHQSLGRHGSFAEYVPIAAQVLLPMPDALPMATAAGVPCPALTAWLAVDKLPDLSGEPMLVSGAGGAVANYLVQFARLRGWLVTAMCNPRHWERLLSLGASAVRPGPLAPGEVWADEAPFTAVVDSINGDHAARLASTLYGNGHLVAIQGRVAQWPDPPFTRAISLHEVALGALHVHGDAHAWARLTASGERILAAIAEGSLVPEPTVEGTFDTLPAMLDGLRHRDFSGKPVVTL
jgi:NADPH:quinone reductase-like Zn-dependent oxidoreductase